VVPTAGEDDAAGAAAAGAEYDAAGAALPPKLLRKSPGFGAATLRGGSTYFCGAEVDAAGAAGAEYDAAGAAAAGAEYDAAGAALPPKLLRKSPGFGAATLRGGSTYFCGPEVDEAYDTAGAAGAANDAAGGANDAAGAAGAAGAEYDAYDDAEADAPEPTALR